MMTSSAGIITQEELSVGSNLMENVSLATRICKIYMDDLHRRLALGETIEPGPLTYKREMKRVCYAKC